jgi:hypothetical protein
VAIMQPHMLAQLLGDTDAVARSLLEIRSLLPAANVSRLAAVYPEVLLQVGQSPCLFLCSEHTLSSTLSLCMFLGGRCTGGRGAPCRSKTIFFHPSKLVPVFQPSPTCRTPLHARLQRQRH